MSTAKLSVLRKISQAADLVKIKVSAGAGGHGLPKYGGIGGKGGDVYVKGDEKILTLRQVVKNGTEFKAPPGSPSKRTKLIGVQGSDIIIKCPVGVTVYDETNTRLGDINTPKDQVLVALGGRGGSTENELHGVRGEKKVVKLDLKIIADVGFVGLPNAGKSTLLKAISRANPKIASYPFTTIRPNLGHIQFPDYRTISIADLPGLVEDAHKNRGLGHNFLKHASRTRLLAFVVDAHNNNPLINETISLLLNEIRLYDELMLRKPSILVLTKLDLPHAHTNAKKFIDHCKQSQFEEVLPVSSETGENIGQLKEILRQIIDIHAEDERSGENLPIEFNRIQT